MSPLSYIVTAASLVAAVSAHGYVQSFFVNGQTTAGFNPGLGTSAPANPGWYTTAMDNGFVAPSEFGSADMICHRGGTPGKAYVEVAAGGKITLNWNTWPESHKGPVIDYLASCNGDCTSVSKGNLRFNKIAQGGHLSGSNPGTFVTDNLIRDGNKWTVTIPSSLKAGNYVLRHEIIALHAAGNQNGAQAYPQCVNIKVTGGGTASLSGGVAATSLYSPSDAGILFNLYRSYSSYPIPGPSVWNGRSAKRHARDIEMQ